MRDRRVDRQRDQRVAALASRLTCMPAMLTPASPRMRPTVPTTPGPVVVAEERHVLGRRDLDVEAVDLDQLLDVRGPDSVPDTETWRAVGQRAAHGDQVAVVGRLGVGGQADLDAALLGEQRAR